MPAPLGNQYALGNTGRPKTHDYEQIGKEFVEWALNNPDAFTVPQFSAPRGLSSDIFWRWAKDNEEFSRLFLIGKELIGINRLKASNTKDEFGNAKLDKGIYMKTLHHYDLDIRQSDRDEKKFDSSLKADENKTQQTVNIYHKYGSNNPPS